MNKRSRHLAPGVLMNERNRHLAVGVRHASPAFAALFFISVLALPSFSNNVHTGEMPNDPRAPRTQRGLDRGRPLYPVREYKGPKYTEEESAKILAKANDLYKQAQKKIADGDLTNGYKLLAETLVWRRKLYDENDTFSPKLYTLLGEISMKAKDYKQAQENFRLALTNDMKRFPVGSYELVGDLENMGDAFNDETKYHDAVNYYTQVYQLRLRNCAKSDKNTMRAAIKLSTALQKEGRAPEAEEILKKCDAIIGKYPERVDKDQTVQVLNVYKDVLNSLNKKDEAEELGKRIAALTLSTTNEPPSP